MDGILKVDVDCCVCFMLGNMISGSSRCVGLLCFVWAGFYVDDDGLMIFTAGILLLGCFLCRHFQLPMIHTKVELETDRFLGKLLDDRLERIDEF